jgi:hypothetical protein
MSKKKTAKSTRKTTPRFPRSKKAAPRYNPQTGKLTGRAIKAQERLDALTQKYQAEGMAAQDARQRAREELRSNPRRDWRGG